MIRVVIAVSTASLGVGGGVECRAQGASNERSRAADSVEAVVRQEMRKRQIPGLQVAIVRQGKVVFSGVYGLANLQDSVPATPRTAFTINSITKAFVGVAVMQLVEEGKADLEAPVSRYLDSLPEAWRGVRLRQLLTHTSGLPDVFADYGRMNTDEGSAEAWKKVQTMPMDFTPGHRFAYNQTNYVLLGQIIDKLTGRPFAQFIAERQFRVVGMPVTDRSGFSDARDIIPHGVRVYTSLGGGGLRNAVELYPMYLRTALGLSSTAEEMARWVIALQGGTLLSKSGSLAALWTPAKMPDGSTGGFDKLLNGYALGFPVAVRPRHRAVAAIGGARSAVFIYPDDDLTVVVLTNLQGAFPEAFIDEIARQYIPGLKRVAGS